MFQHFTDKQMNMLFSIAQSGAAVSLMAMQAMDMPAGKERDDHIIGIEQCLTLILLELEVGGIQ